MMVEIARARMSCFIKSPYVDFVDPLHLFSERDPGACAQYREAGLMGSVFRGAAFLFCARACTHKHGSLARMSALGANRKCRVGGNDANDPQQTLLPRRTGILPFRFRLPLTRQLLRFGDLCRGHPPRDAISIADRILVTSRSRQTEPHVCVNIVLRHA